MHSIADCTHLCFCQMFLWIHTNISHVWGNCAADSGGHGGNTQPHVPYHSGKKLSGIEIHKGKGPCHTQFPCHCQGDRQGIVL